MRKVFWRAVFLVFLLIATGTNGFSQLKAIWLGAGISTSIEEISTTFDLNFQIKEKWYVNGLANYNQKIPVDNVGYKSSASFGVGGGYLWKKGPYIITASSGILATGAVYSLPSGNEAGFGIPIRVQTIITTKYIGIGLNAYYQFDTTKSYGGIGIILVLGRMR